MRLLFMQQINTYFFGKLNQSRDFIVSENLQDNDKTFGMNGLIVAPTKTN